MIRSVLKIVFLIAFIWNSTHIRSCTIDRGFEALEMYDYFKAKQIFEKKIDQHKAIAAYGLSKIYLRKDNPFHDLGLAYYYANESIIHYQELTQKKKNHWDEKFSINEETLSSFRNKVSEHYFELAQKKHTIFGYADFIAMHPWSPLVKKAIELRQDLAYEYAITKGKSEALAFFMEYYSGSKYDDEVEKELLLAQFKETTAANTINSFERFIELYPNSPYVKEAEDKIFAKFLQEYSIEQLTAFIKKYPYNRNTKNAWLKLYRLSLTDYSKSSIEQFIKKYPDFPFPEKIDEDLKLVETELFPFKLAGKFGFMDSKGLPLIPAQYKYAGTFNSGLAAVAKEDKIGFIDKNNQLIIPFEFDDAQGFLNGRSIVEVDGLYGLIDRSGNFVIEPVYEDLGSFSEGFCYAYKDGQYMYLNRKGEVMFNMAFDEAFAFQNGLAKVALNDEIGFLQTNGSFYIRKDADELRYFSDSVFVITRRDSSNLIHVNGDYLLTEFVDRIGTLSENRAIIEKDDKYGYIDSLGNVVVPVSLIPYSNYFQFSEYRNGHARYRKGDKYGLMDSLGNRIFPAIFTNIGDFGELVPVTKGNGWGFADERTRLQLRYIYDYAYSFEEGTSIVQMDGKMGVINTKGEELIPFEYSEIQRMNDSLFVVKSDRVFALFDSRGKRLTPLKYFRFNHISDTFIQLESEETIDYFDITKRELIALIREDE